MAPFGGKDAVAQQAQPGLSCLVFVRYRGIHCVHYSPVSVVSVWEYGMKTLRGVNSSNISSCDDT